MVVEEEKKEIEEGLEEVFSAEDLEKAWAEFKIKRIAAGAGDTEQLVLGRTLSKGDGNQVTITLTSALEGSILDRFEQDLVQFLRKSLRNAMINLNREMQEQEQSKKLYTSRDKFDYMVQQNPALQELKDRLGLDFEY